MTWDRNVGHPGFHPFWRPFHQHRDEKNWKIKTKVYSDLSFISSLIALLHKRNVSNFICFSALYSGILLRFAHSSMKKSYRSFSEFLISSWNISILERHLSRVISNSRYRYWVHQKSHFPVYYLLSGVGYFSDRDASQIQAISRCVSDWTVPVIRSTASWCWELLACSFCRCPYIHKLFESPVYGRLSSPRLVMICLQVEPLLLSSIINRSSLLSMRFHELEWNPLGSGTVSEWSVWTQPGVPDARALKKTVTGRFSNMEKRVNNIQRNHTTVTCKRYSKSSFINL